MKHLRTSLFTLGPAAIGLLVFLYFFGFVNGALCWAIGALFSIRLGERQRYRQWLLPIVALLWSLAVLGFSLWLRFRYQQWLLAHASLQAWLNHWLGFTFPPDVAGAILFWNAVFLALFALAKLFWILWLRVSEKPPVDRPLAPWALAYVYRADWALKPWWRYARWFSWGFAFLGLAALVWVWLSLEGALPDPWAATWLPMLAGAIFLVGLELAVWLGGPLDETWQPEFEGGDADAMLRGRFARLWERYRKKWHDKWLAAGNLIPQRLEDERGKG
jgi:hypothetical protein